MTTTTTASVTTLPSSEEVAAHTRHIEGLGQEITRWASDLFAGESRFLTLVGEFDELGGWADGRTRSCAHWLNWKLGIAMPAARERVRVARRLRELTLRTWRQVQTQAAPDAADAQRQRRDVQLRVDEDGSLLLSACLPAEVGAQVVQALKAAMEVMVRADGPAREEDLARRRADAMAAIAESFLAHGPTGSSSADHWQLVVHADADTLAAAADGEAHVESWWYDDSCGSEVPEEDLGDPLGDVPSARIQDGTVVADPVLRRLACDTTLVGMASRDGEPVGVGRRTRTVPGWLRRLLHRRDPGCMFPGCPNTVWTDAHHIWHWTDGGPTVVDNLIRLCRGHHSHVHAAGIGIGLSIMDRTWTFHDADGQPIKAAVSLPGRSGQPLPVGEGLSMWQGDHVHLDPIIDALVHAATAHAPESGQAVPAETSPSDPPIIAAA